MDIHAIRAHSALMLNLRAIEVRFHAVTATVPTGKARSPGVFL